MAGMLSPRLRALVNALPLRPGLRVIEIGCGPGAMAREMASRIGNGHVLAIDRSARAIAQAVVGSQREIAAGTLEFRASPAESFALRPGERPYDLAVAIRVGALDGRHPELAEAALACIRAALAPGGKLFIDGGNPLRELQP